MALDLVPDFAATPCCGGFHEGEALLFSRFRHWRGRSGRAYAFSVYAPADCPAYENAVLMIVARRGGALACVDLGPLPEATLGEFRRLYADRLADIEFQIHVLADRAAERAALIADLSPLCA